MLPISEFAFCGIATVAATLGYACARRAALSFTPTSEPSKADVEVGSTSLKRKLDDADEHDVDLQETPRPMKRNKTPPTHPPEADDDEWEIIVAPPSYEQATALRQPLEPQRHDSGTPSQENIHDIKRADTPAREPTLPLQPDENGADAGRCSTPQPLHATPDEPVTPPAHPITPHKPASKIDAFSAFSGSSSPFTSCSKISGTSPFAVSGQTVKAAPAWRRDNKCESDVFGRNSDSGTLGEVKPLPKASTYLTGEEDEIVDAELKGVKLFIKRGRKEFTDGIYGHIKVLTRKPTGNEDLQGTESETGSRTRLLFRRDPLGQVSMNAGLHPTVRCHFDVAENILRVILMEKVTTDETSIKEDVVIYALKPGRAGKAEFESFSRKLCSHEGLGSQMVAAPGDAAAS